MKKLSLVFRSSAVVSGIIFLSLFFSGCSHEYYTANVQQVPLFTEKHQVQISGFAGGGDQTKTNDLQVAVSVADHIAIMGSGMWIRGDKNNDNNYNSGSYANKMYGRYGEIGAGYFQKIGERWVFETYGGYGSSFQHHDYDSLETATLRYSKYFIQPVMGYKREHFEFGLSFRISYLNFTDIATNHVDSGFPTQTGYTFFEPAFTIRTGFDFIKFQAQWQLITPLASNRSDFNYSGSMANIGVQFVIGARKKKPVE